MIDGAVHALENAGMGIDPALSRSVARTVIAALRDPPPYLLEKVLPGLADFGFFPDEWNSLIDEILREPQRG